MFESLFGLLARHCHWTRWKRKDLCACWSDRVSCQPGGVTCSLCFCAWRYSAKVKTHLPLDCETSGWTLTLEPRNPIHSHNLSFQMWEAVFAFLRISGFRLRLRKWSTAGLGGEVAAGWRRACGFSAGICWEASGAAATLLETGGCGGRSTGTGLNPPHGFCWGFWSTALNVMLSVCLSTWL